MPPRSLRPGPMGRRGASPRWLVVPLAITVLVLLLDASMHARNPKPAQALSAQAWVDRVLPLVTASSAQGRQLDKLATSPLNVNAQTVARELAGIARAAASADKAAASLAPPPQVAAANGLLEAALSARAQGAAQMASAANELMVDGREASSSADKDMAGAAGDFEVGDRAYRLFAAALPELRVQMPPSQWDANPSAFGAVNLAAFSRRVLAVKAAAPAHLLAIDAVTTTPPALSVQADTEVLSPASSLSVTVVVADTSRAPESAVAVAATITPAKGSASQRVSATVDLAAGEAYALTLSGLQIVPSTQTTLTVTVQGPGGAAASASRALKVEVPGPSFSGVSTSSTTSTSLGPTSTTLATTTT